MKKQNQTYIHYGITITVSSVCLHTPACACVHLFIYFEVFNCASIALFHLILCSHCLLCAYFHQRMNECNLLLLVVVEVAVVVTSFSRSLSFHLRGNQIEISENNVIMKCQHYMMLLNTTLMASVNYLRIKMHRAERWQRRTMKGRKIL